MRAKKPSKAVFGRLRAGIAKFRPYGALHLRAKPVKVLSLVLASRTGFVAATLPGGRWTVLSHDVRRFTLHDKAVGYRVAGDGDIEKGLRAMKALRIVDADDVDLALAYLGHLEDRRYQSQDLRRARRIAEAHGYKLVRRRVVQP